MNETKFLYERLEKWFGEREIKNTPLPPIITKNLNPNFSLREYQKKAFQYFINYWEENQTNIKFSFIWRPAAAKL